MATETSGLARLLSVAEDMPNPQTKREELFVLGVLFQVLLSHVTNPAPLLDRARHVMKCAIEAWSKPAAFSRADRAANIIAARATDALDVESVAHEVACDVTLLRRDFKRRFGTSMREYHVRTRVQVVVRLIAGGCGTNREIAAAAGYESQKNFYGATRRVTRQRPSELRTLSADALEELASSIIPVPRRIQDRSSAKASARRLKTDTRVQSPPSAASGDPR